MSSVEYLKPDYPKNAFEGTADYYSGYRIPYPQVLFDDLTNRVNLRQHSIMLDLASGPGRVAIPIAHLFSKVIACDIEPEMVTAGKTDAKKNDINNIEWFVDRAEDLKIEPGTIDLITIGDAFHRLDQSLILDLAKKWLKPGAHIAIIGMYSLWRGNENWHKLVNTIINKWTQHLTVYKNSEFRDYGLLLEDKGFLKNSSYLFEFPHHHTIDTIIGYLFSTSRCSKKVLGFNAFEFETEIKTELKKLNRQGIFFEKVRCGYTLGKKPLD